MALTGKKVPVVYSEMHHRHNPPYEYDRGQQIPYQEVPRRIEAALEALAGLPFTEIIHSQKKLPVESLTTIHDPALIQHLQKMTTKAAASEFGTDTYLYPWIYPLNAHMRKQLLNSPDPGGCFAFDLYAPIGTHTWDAVLQSASLAVEAAEFVLNGSTDLSYALCRPPGHHAGISMIGGYCYLNNAALAAQSLLPLGKGVILDIDYHHGNGTQEIFWDRSDVMYVSIHADPKDEYPFFSGYAEERGGPQAVGANRNFPLSKGCDDTLYLQTLSSALREISIFQPDWLVLSAGYDTVADDTSTFFELSPEAFPQIGAQIKSLGIPVVVIHEGGYAVEHNGILSAKLLSGLVQSD